MRQNREKTETDQTKIGAISDLTDGKGQVVTHEELDKLLNNLCEIFVKLRNFRVNYYLAVRI